MTVIRHDAAPSPLADAAESRPAQRRQVRARMENSRSRPVRGRERLGSLDLQDGLADRDRSLAGLGAEHLEAEVLVRVALAELRAAVESGHDRHRRCLLVDAVEGMAAAAQVDRIGRRAHDDDLARIDGAAQPGPCLHLDRHWLRSPLSKTHCS